MFGKKSVNEDFYTIDIKEEPISHFDTQNSYDDQKFSTHNLFSQSSPITEDNFMLVVPKVKREPTDKSYMNNYELSDLESGIDIATPSEIQESDNLMAISEPHQMLKIAKCELCLQEFSTECSKKRHIESVHEGKIYVCDKCEKEFRYSASLLKHKKKHHSKKKKEEIEHRNANITKENKNVPIDKKCGAQFRPISCSICNKKFSDRPGLNRHSRIVHDKIKIAKCELCLQEFNTECSKKRHIESVHEGKIYSCDKCEKEFSYSASLLKHKKNHHHSNEDLIT